MDDRWDDGVNGTAIAIQTDEETATTKDNASDTYARLRRRPQRLLGRSCWTKSGLESPACTRTPQASPVAGPTRNHTPKACSPAEPMYFHIEHSEERYGSSATSSFQHLLTAALSPRGIQPHRTSREASSFHIADAVCKSRWGDRAQRRPSPRLVAATSGCQVGTWL